MGTPEQKAHRAQYRSNDQAIIDWMTSGAYTGDQSLYDFTRTHGGDPMYNLYKSDGPYAVYGPSWDPGYNFDFEHNQKIPWQSDPSQTWYDPSNPENWQNTDPLQVARINGYYNWRNSPEGQAAGNQFGGNNIAAWYAGRAHSGQPNSPDMGWTGTHYAGQQQGQQGWSTDPLGGNGQVSGGPYAGPVPFGGQSQMNGQSQFGINDMFGMLGNPIFRNLISQYTGTQPWLNNPTPTNSTTGLPSVLGLANGGTAWGYIDPAWGGQRNQQSWMSPAPAQTPTPQSYANPNAKPNYLPQRSPAAQVWPFNNPSRYPGLGL